MIRSKFAVVCALMVFAGSALFAQDTPPKKSSRTEHRPVKAGWNKSAGTSIESGISHSPQTGSDQWGKGSGSPSISSKAGKGGARTRHKHIGGVK